MTTTAATAGQAAQSAAHALVDLAGPTAPDVIDDLIGRTVGLPAHGKSPSLDSAATYAAVAAYAAAQADRWALLAHTAGASWADVGAALSVSRQAAQQRLSQPR